MPRDGLFSFDAPKLEQTFVFNMIGLSIVSLVALSSCTFAAPATESGRDIRSNSGNAVTSITTTKATSSALEYLISFGNPYSTTGFDINSTKPSSSNPLGNPAFPGYTSENGNNWIDDLITVYNTSLLLSYNFADGGATTSASLVTPYTSTVLSRIDQVSEFSTFLASRKTNLCTMDRNQCPYHSLDGRQRRRQWLVRQQLDFSLTSHHRHVFCTSRNPISCRRAQLRLLDRAADPIHANDGCGGR